MRKEIAEKAEIMDGGRENNFREKRFVPGWVKAAVGICAVLLLSVMTEILICNRHAMKDQCDSFQGESEDGFVELEFGSNRYIKTITIDRECDEDTAFQLLVYDEDGTLCRSMYSTVNAKLDQRVVNIRTYGSRVTVELDENISGILRVKAENFFEWNPVRLLFFLVLFGLTAYFILAHKAFKEKPELVFGVISFSVGILLIVITGTNQISYDEQTHVAKIWNLSFIGTVYDTDATLECKTLTVPVFHNIWEREAVEAHLDNINDYDTANLFYQTKMISYDKRAYLPMAAGMAAGRILKLPFAAMISLSKFCNLLMYTLICAFAIRIAKKGKGLVAVVALLPNSIFSASQFSYDACVNCFLILAMVLVMNELLEPERRVKPVNMLAILSCFIIGSYSKQIYILMALLILFFGYRKFPSKSGAVLFKAVLTILCLVMVYEVLSPSYSGTSAAMTLANAGDDRTEGSSTLGQISYILHNPVTFAKLLLSSMFGRIIRWLNGRDQFLMYAYMGTPGTIYTWIWFITWGFAGLVTPAGEGRRGIGRKYIVLNLLMTFCMSAVIWVVLYLSFNVVGSGTIEGVQNRYFTPLFLPVGMCLLNRRVLWRWKEESYYKLLFGICAALLLYCNWKLGVCAYYL